MKNLLLSAALLGLFTGVASAQVAPPSPTPPAADSGVTPPPPPPPGGPGAGAPGRMGKDGPTRKHDHRGPPPPPSDAAHFRVDTPGLRLDVRCAEDEPMRACADIALQLIERARVEAPAPRP